MSLVRKLGVVTVCETYMCQNMAEVEIGHELIPAGTMHVCGDCMREIVKDAVELFPDMKPEPEVVEVVREPEKEPEFYTCKWCGEKFAKPDQLKEYRVHVMRCPRKV